MRIRSGVVGMRVAIRAPRNPPTRLAGAATATTVQSTGAEQREDHQGSVAVTAESADFSALASLSRCSAMPRTPTRITPRAPPK